MKRTRGLTLIEAVVAIALLSVVSILSAELFVSASQSIRNSDKQHNLAWNYDQMVTVLQRDADCSISLSVKNPATLELNCGGNDLRHWTIASGGIVRAAGGQSRQWHTLPNDMFFEQRGTAVILHVPTAAANIVLSSPTTLAKR